MLYQDNIDAETNEVSKWRQIWTFQKNSRYVQIANGDFSAEVVVVMCTLTKKIIIIKLLGYGQLKSATESEFLLSLREHSFDQQIETGSFDVSV